MDRFIGQGDGGDDDDDDEQQCFDMSEYKYVGHQQETASFERWPSQSE